MLFSGTPTEEEEKESRTKRVLSKIRARLISQDRLSRDSFGSVPPSDEDYGMSFDKDDVDDNYLTREGNQHVEVDEEEENENKKEEVSSEDVDVKYDSGENTDDNAGGVDNVAYDKSNDE